VVKTFSEKMKPELIFLKYAFPCSTVLRQRNEITQEMLEKLEDAAINNKIISRDILEKIYFRAISRMKALANERNKNYFCEEIIREYFTKRHNEILDGHISGKNNDMGIDVDKNTPSSLRYLCKVFKARVMEKKENYYIVEYDNKKLRPVLNSLLPDAKIGDVITIHYGYAVEEIK
jgi:hypothetical protein